MKVYELMAFLGKQRADAEVVVHSHDGLLSSEIAEISDAEAGPDTVHIRIIAEFDGDEAQ